MTTTTIQEIFLSAVQTHASDIHFAVGFAPIFRVDGVLIEQKKFLVLEEAQVEDLVFSMLSKDRKELFLKEKEFDFAYELKGVSRFRVNLHVERGHLGMVARIVSSQVPSMKDVGMPDVVFDLLQQNQGLILVTGPSGVGKSTSLAAMIHEINVTRNRHIITLEDPIEFIHESKKSIVKQRQLGDDMLSFQEGLKHVLRQDPNVILVGEIRDLESIAATITLAETGHLVLATLHTLNAAQTIDRIIDVFPPYQQNQVRLQLSMFLKAIISQQLLPKKTGGRIAAREILLNSPAVANLIRENKIEQIRTVIQTSGDEGMITMDQTLKQLYEQGLIEKQVAQSYMVTPSVLR